MEWPFPLQKQPLDPPSALLFPPWEQRSEQPFPHMLLLVICLFLSTIQFKPILATAGSCLGAAGASLGSAIPAAGAAIGAALPSVGVRYSNFFSVLKIFLVNAGSSRCQYWSSSWCWNRNGRSYLGDSGSRPRRSHSYLYRSRKFLFHHLSILNSISESVSCRGSRDRSRCSCPRGHSSRRWSPWFGNCRPRD